MARTKQTARLSTGGKGRKRAPYGLEKLTCSLRYRKDTIGVYELPWTKDTENKLKAHVQGKKKAFLVRFNRTYTLGCSEDEMSRLLVYVSRGSLRDAFCFSVNLRGPKMEKWRAKLQLAHIKHTTTRLLGFKGTSRELLDRLNASAEHEIVEHVGFLDFQVKGNKVKCSASKGAQRRMRDDGSDSDDGSSEEEQEVDDRGEEQG